MKTAAVGKKKIVYLFSQRIDSPRQTLCAICVIQNEIDLFHNMRTVCHFVRLTIVCLALGLVSRGLCQTQIYTTKSLVAVTAAGPNGVAIDQVGNIYFSIGNAIEKYSVSGSATIIAGSIPNAGSGDGVGSSASFNAPTGIAVDLNGNIYVTDSGNNAIRKINSAGVVTTVAGLIQGNIDGTGLAARFNNPQGIALDSAGNLYIGDTGNNEIRKITVSGVTSTIFSGSTLPSVYEGGGAPPICDLAVDSSGNIYFSANQPTGLGYLIIGKINPNGTFTQIYATGSATGVGNFVESGGIAIDPNGNVFSTYNSSLFIVGSNGTVTSFPWNLGTSTHGITLAADSIGRIYIADSSDANVFVSSPVGVPPAITVQPTGATIAYGATSSLAVTATGSMPLAYQWQANGVNIAGATGANYVTSTPGIYTVVVTNAAGSVTSGPAVVSAATRLIDISSRAQVGAGGNIMIAGFVVNGPPGTTEQVLVRGVGPALSQFGVTGLLAQPVLTLYGANGNVLATNTGWSTNSNATQIAAAFATTGAFTLPVDGADSALLTNLPPGAYTAEVSGLNGTTGIALAEVYEVTAGSPELINISTRALVASGSSVEIAGIVISGTQSAKLLIRAVGPALTQFGVTGVLAQPVLNVVNSSGVTVASNTGWSTNSNAATIASETAAVGAFALPTGSADCAVLVTLPPGAYTAVVSGVGGSAGVALVEAYQAP